MVLLLKVAGDPLSEIDSLAYIDHRIPAVFEEVASGQMGQRIRGDHILMADEWEGIFIFSLS
jgi:hypothetical protein